MEEKTICIESKTKLYTTVGTLIAVVVAACALIMNWMSNLSRVEAVEVRMTSIEDQQDKLEKAMDRIESSVNGIDVSIASINTTLNTLDFRRVN